jgi:diguanylate cyclase (GGDEF)-like protein
VQRVDQADMDASGGGTHGPEIEALLASATPWRFPARLEANYQECQGSGRRKRSAFVLIFFAGLALAASLLDVLNGPALVLTVLPVRLIAAAFLLLCAAGLRRLTNRVAVRLAETLLIAVAIVVLVMTTEWIGEQAGPKADRYIMTAAFAASFAIILMPVTLFTARIVCAVCVLTFPVVPALLPRALGLPGNWDLLAFAAGTMACAAYEAQRAERRDRLAFLYRRRHELAAVELNIMNSELLRLATVDALTGLQNRRAFNSGLARLWHDRCHTLSVVLMDVDWFKPYNDTAGHLAGDAVLQAVARAIQGAIRDGEDIAARYGGEEFVVLMPDMSLGGAQQAAERLRQAILALGIPHPGRDNRPVTISVGVASLSAVERLASTPEAMLRNADAALYAAKQHGRNRVMLAGWMTARSQEVSSTGSAVLI